VTEVVNPLRRRKGGKRKEGDQDKESTRKNIRQAEFVEWLQVAGGSGS